MELIDEIQQEVIGDIKEETIDLQPATSIKEELQTHMNKLHHISNVS